MKRCPECGREYDSSMMFCLDDGAELLYGPASADEPATAILSASRVPPSDGSLSESPTRAQIDTTNETAISPTGTGEIVPKSRALDRRLLAAPFLLAIIVLGGFFGYRYFTPTKQIESIAVMPFVNESGNADVEYLADGMTETLIGSLSQLPNLNVKARSSVFRYKGKETSAQTIGKELNVQAVLNGRVVQRGEDLILYLELVDAATENSLWKHTYSKTMASLIALQDDIARDVADKLRVKLSATDRQRLGKSYTENTAAFEAYLRGRHIWNKGPAPGYEKSREYFQLAIDKDPAYALAFTGLADFYGFSAAYGLSPPEESWARCESAVNKALELDDTLAEAYNPLAAVKVYFHHDWPAAEQAFRRGIALNPNFAEIRHHYAIRLVSFGRSEEGLAEMQRALELDPLSARFNLSRARLLFMARSYDGALDQIRKTLELDPNEPSIHELLGNIYEQKNMHNEAVAAWVKAMRLRGESEKATAFEQSFARHGFAAASRSLAESEIVHLDEKRKRGDYVPPIEYMTAYTRMGDVEQALSWFARVEEERSGFRFDVNVNPIFDSLRRDPRFRELVDKISPDTGK